MERNFETPVPLGLRCCEAGLCCPQSLCVWVCAWGGSQAQGGVGWALGGRCWDDGPKHSAVGLLWQL